MYLTRNDNTVKPVIEQVGREVLVKYPEGNGYDTLVIDCDEMGRIFFYDEAYVIVADVTEVEWWALLPEVDDV